MCQKNSGSASAVISGSYYKHVCESCLNANIKVSSGHARWSRTIDVEDHSFDLQQPYNSDGTPNADFIKAYPTQSAALFSNEEMDKAVRD